MSLMAGFIGTIITILIFLCIPITLIIIKKPRRLKVLKIIGVCNFFLGFILTRIIFYLLNGGFYSVIPTFFWALLGYFLMYDKIRSPLDIKPKKTIIEEDAQLEKDAKIGVILVLSIIGFCILMPILTIFF